MDWRAISKDGARGTCVHALLAALLAALALASAAIDDVTAWGLLALATAVAGTGHASHAAVVIGLAAVFVAGMLVIGRPLFNEQLLFYVAWLLVPVFSFLLMRTRFGLNVRAVGENPFAADAGGVDVVRVRYIAIAIAGTMAGFAGGFLCVSDVKIFAINMTVGQGFIGLAIAMLGKWNPYRIMAGAILFGMLVSLGDGLQILGVNLGHVEFIGMAPYIGVMLALVFLAGRTALPSALGIPYARGSR